MKVVQYSYRGSVGMIHVIKIYRGEKGKGEDKEGRGVMAKKSKVIIQFIININ